MLKRNLRSLCILVIWISSASFGQPTTSTSVQFSRSTLILGDPDRDWTLLWSRDGFYRRGEKPVAPKLVAESPTSNSATYDTDDVNLRERSETEHTYWSTLRVRPGTPPGKYKVTLHDRPIGSISIAKKPNRRMVTMPAGSTVQEINSQFASGADVTLGAGEHHLTTPLVMSPGSQLRGFNATLTGETTEYQKSLVRLADDCTIVGVTFRPGLAAMTGSGRLNEARNVTLSDCTFHNCMLGIFDSPNLQLNRCKFERAGVPNCNGGTFIHCDWNGQAVTGHSLSLRDVERLAIVQCGMNGTDRGPILRGSINDPLLVGIRLSNIDEVHNGCEICCIEGGKDKPGVNNGLFMCWRATNCVGPFQPFDTPFRNNLLYDFKLDGPWIIFWGLADQSRNQIQDCELNGGGIVFNMPGQIDAANNLVTDTAVLNWRLNRQNQMNGHPNHYARPDWPMLGPVGDYSNRATGNQTTRVTVQGQPANVTPFRNMQAK